MAKSTKVSGWRSRSSGFLAGIAAGALIVALVGGMALGYEIEKSRVKSTTKTSAAARAAKSRKKTASKGKYVVTRADGTITATSATSITVTSKRGVARKIAIGKNAVYVKLVGGALSDITANERVLLSGGGSYTKARAVIVLPTATKIGMMVSAVTPTTMSLKLGTKTAQITTTGAAV